MVTGPFIKETPSSAEESSLKVREIKKPKFKAFHQREDLSQIYYHFAWSDWLLQWCESLITKMKGDVATISLQAFIPPYWHKSFTIMVRIHWKQSQPIRKKTKNKQRPGIDRRHRTESPNRRQIPKLYKNRLILTFQESDHLQLQNHFSCLERPTTSEDARSVRQASARWSTQCQNQKSNQLPVQIVLHWLDARP